MKTTIVAQDFEQCLMDLQHSIDQYIPQLESMGISIDTARQTTAYGPLLATGEKLTASTHWWGIDLVMNEKLTQDIIDGITGTGTVGTAIASALGAAGIITGGVATIIGAGIASVVAIKIAQIKITNNGKGVHWPITWIQWAALLSTVLAGPAGVLAAGALFLHPIRN